MPLPPISQNAVLDALRRFDADLRSTSDWAGWENNNAHKYALIHEGQSYPIKQIVSLASGVPVSEFSGGPEANGLLQRLGFTVEHLRLPTESEVRIALHELLL